MAQSGSQIALQALSRRSTESENAPNYQQAGAQHSAHDLPPDAASVHHSNEELPAYSRAAPPPQLPGQGHSARLHRSAFIPLLTAFFAVLVIYSWVMLAMLSFRPISTRSWEVHTRKYYGDYPKNLDYAIDEKIYRSARVIQSVASVIILPWTSAVCAFAAVIFVQNQKNASNMTMRQVINLADRRWMDVSMIFDLVTGNWKKHGSVFLALAVLLHFLALIIYPIQSIVVTPRIKRVPRFLHEQTGIGDFLELKSQYDEYSGSDVVQARNAFVGADKHTWQPFLWSERDQQEFSTLMFLSGKQNPFFSPLPSGFNTGVFPQYAPRVNSNATVRAIDESEYPSDCASETTNLFANYSSIYEVVSGSGYTYSHNWSISACMLSSNTSSPWTSTRDRQEFTEVLYINAIDRSAEYPYRDMQNGTLLEIKLHTTAGYFELPNYSNNQTAGPLLDKDPVGNCKKGDYGCIQQSRISSPIYNSKTRRQSDSSDNSTTTITNNQTIPWNQMVISNKGPLLTTALAIFGPGSFLNTFFAEYDIMETSLSHAKIDYDSLGDSSDRFVCLEVPPLQNMYGTSSGVSWVSRDTCVSIYLSSDEREFDSEAAHLAVAKWMDSTFSDLETLENTFNAAAFLANKRFISALDTSFSIYQDLGSEIIAPESSIAGITICSLFLAIHLFFIVALSWYGSYYPRWTSRLDSFTMLRTGAAYGNGIFPLLATRNTQDVKVLDGIPGVVRDVAGVQDDVIIPIGRFGFGEGKPLRWGRRYEAYEGDNEPLTPSEVFKIRRGGR